MAARQIAVKCLREILDRTQAQFAAMIGVSKHTVVSWENGRNRLEERAALRISAATGAHIELLLKNKLPVRFVNLEEYEKKHLDLWKSIRQPYADSADHMSSMLANDLKFLLCASAMAGTSGLKDRFPGVLESFMDWAKRTSRDFDLDPQIADLVAKRKIPYRLTRTYAGWRARWPHERKAWGFKDDLKKPDGEQLTLVRYRSPYFQSWDRSQERLILQHLEFTRQPAAGKSIFFKEPRQTILRRPDRSRARGNLKK